MEEFYRILEQQEGEVNNQILNDILLEHRPKRDKMMRFYKEYKGDTPIHARQFEDKTKINNKLNNDFRGEIVDQFAGYLFGEPITYWIKQDNYSDSEYDRGKEKLNDFILKNSVDDLDSETGKMKGICGYGARLLYIDPDGEEKITDIDPWEAVVIRHPSSGEPQYGLRYYEVDDFDNIKQKWYKKHKLEWYDSTYVYFYEGSGVQIGKDRFVKTGEQPHGFDYVPLIEFPNNKEKIGDFEKVTDLIEAINRTVSDAQNELEEFRQAYMVFEGAEIDEQTIKEARKSGAFSLPEGSNAAFLVKEINDTFLQNHLKTLEENIYRFSKTVNYRDEKFSGGEQSGESRKWKLLPLENQATTKERKFTKALRQQFKVLCSKWQKEGININYEDIKFQFTRNLPADMLHEAEVTEKLKGQVSEGTRLSLLSFVDDPDSEKEAMEEDMEGLDVDLDQEEGEADES